MIPAVAENTCGFIRSIIIAHHLPKPLCIDLSLPADRAFASVGSDDFDLCAESNFAYRLQSFFKQCVVLGPVILGPKQRNYRSHFRHTEELIKIAAELFIRLSDIFCQNRLGSVYNALNACKIVGSFVDLVQQGREH